jgi:uncharacterized protein YecT (DUF1311 family)
MLAIAALFLAAGLSGYDGFQPSDDAIHAHYTAALHACENAPENGGTFQQAMCMFAEDQRQDKALNAVWARVMARLDARRSAELRANQRQWIKDRAASATEDAAGAINSTAKYMYNASYADETIRRTIWLEHLR